MVIPQPTAALGFLPGALAGFGTGVIFTTLATSTPLNSAENVLITGVCAFLSACLFGFVSHVLGQIVLKNEYPTSSSRLFDGDVAMAGVVHSGLWGLVFFVLNGLLIVLNPDQVSLVRERVNVMNNSRPELAPIPIPSSPGSGRHAARSVFENANQDDDPNRVKSSPSRYDSRRAGLTPVQEAQQQAKRDAVVVDVLKNAGFKLEGGAATEPAKP